MRTDPQSAFNRREHIDFYYRLQTNLTSAKRTAAVAMTLGAFRLTKLADRPVFTLSQGNRQKLVCALAMTSGNRVIFLDQPSAGMDVGTTKSLWKIISDVRRREQRTVVVATSSVEEADALCTRLAIMCRGSVRCFGPVQRLKDRYHGRYKMVLHVKNDTAEAAVACDALVNSIATEVELIDFFSVGILRPAVFSPSPPSSDVPPHRNNAPTVWRPWELSRRRSVHWRKQKGRTSLKTMPSRRRA